MQGPVYVVQGNVTVTESSAINCVQPLGTRRVARCCESEGLL